MSQTSLAELLSLASPPVAIVDAAPPGVPHVSAEQLGGLEGQDFIRMIDTILGPPPAGSGPILTMTAHQPHLRLPAR